MTMERVKMELEPPRDRYRLIYLTLLLHGLGTLIPWNMFITAKSVSGRQLLFIRPYCRQLFFYSGSNEFFRFSSIFLCLFLDSSLQYFVDYKLGEDYTGIKSNYAGNFLAYLGFAAQIPNVLFNWLNIFIEVG